MPEKELFYIDSLGPLYRDVQLQEVFPDSKYFVDCIPKGNPDLIVTAYQQQKDKPGFDIKQFVTAHFDYPSAHVSNYHSGNKTILQHLEDVWSELTRLPEDDFQGTLIKLPFPYVVPGGRFREVYYWDSYFTMLGLQVSKRTGTIQHMVDNFAYLIDHFGFIPNGNRTYYLSRSQPPFFTLMVELLAAEKGADTLTTYQPQIEKEYAFWMDGEDKLTAAKNTHRHLVLLPDGNILNRYWDDRHTARPEAFAEDSAVANEAGGDAALLYSHIRAAAASGWDFSSRWFRDGQHMTTIQTAHIIPVDLNCLLLHMEEVLLQVYSSQQQAVLMERFQRKIINRKKAIQQYCWDAAKGFYFDYHFIDGAITGQYTLAGAYPLYFSIAGKAEAAATARIIEERFLQPGGLVSTNNRTGQQWDAPNGWAPLQWMAYKGLKNYDCHTLAEMIKTRWMATTEKVYQATGKIMEKYNVTEAAGSAGGGEYPNQDGFGWSNGVYLAFSSEK